MKNKILFLFALVPILGFSQTEQEKQRIASYSNKEANAKLAQELKTQEEQRVIRLQTYLQNNPSVNAVLYDDEKGKLELMDVLPNGEMIFSQTDNAGAAVTARANHLYSGGSLGLNVQGQNMTPAVWDGGTVRSTHQEFMVGGTSKVTNMDTSAMADHATHVAGTIAAQGIVPSVRGLAFNSSVLSYDWTNDLSEMLSEAANGLLVSNHSYSTGALNSIYFFGAYDSRAQSIDQMCYNNPYYLPVLSGGNDRNDPDPPASTQISNKGGYDMVKGQANAKNVMTVAAVNEVANYTTPISVQMSSFSSYGPSDDGRIKPDISMKGVSVRSTVTASDTSTAYMSGTSMASPGITGVATLLQQYHNQLYSGYMRAATLKGLILHTADEAGFTLGPDYRFGWGLVNAKSAAEAIRDKTTLNNGSVIEENTLVNGATFTKTIVANGTGTLKVSISWTDPASPIVNNGAVDPSDVYLVNDLDVKVINSSGDVVYYPWKGQGMATPSLAASRTSTNDVDNFERVDISNPNDTYTIQVTHKGTLAAPQNFSLIVTGPSVTNVLSTKEEGKELRRMNVYPNPAKDQLFLKNFSEGKINIFDVSGKLVLKADARDKVINVAALSSGNYYLMFEGADNTKNSFKFIKE